MRTGDINPLSKGSMTNHQRQGSKSNSHVGKAFELKVKRYLIKTGVDLEANFSVKIGLPGTIKKPHRFDLGCDTKKILVECKSHTWTISGSVPSAKMATWNQAMYFFLASPPAYRKILFVRKSTNKNGQETLAEYFVRIYGNMIPKGVEIWEFDEKSNRGAKVISKKAGQS